MTNVPGVGFLAILVAIVTLLALPVLAGVSLAVSRVSKWSLTRTLVGVHVGAILAGLVAFVLSSSTLLTEYPLRNLVGFARTAPLVVGGGLVVALLLEGGPTLSGAFVTRVVSGVSWQTGLWYATVGYVLGGIGGLALVLGLTGALQFAAFGGLLAIPGAVVLGPLLEATTTRLGPPTAT
jgi:hypothetical protein